MTNIRKSGVGIGVRLGLAFAALAILLLACVAFGILRLGALSHSMEDILTHQGRAAMLAAQLDSDAQAMAKALGQAVLTDSVDDIQIQLKAVDRLHAAGVKTKKDLESLMTSEAGRAAWQRVVGADPAFFGGIAKVTTAVKGGDTDAARQMLNEKSLRLASANYLDALGKLVDLERLEMDGAASTAQQAYAMGRNLLLLAAVVASTIAAVLGWWITGTLTGPARQAVAAANRIARGDLTQDLRSSANDEMGQLLQAMQAMQESLRDVVGRVRANAESVSTASAQIAQGNNDLSQRTEQQAGALQQTAASMEQLGSTVKQGADNARQANQLALGASGVAVKGGEVVTEVVGTMQGISESSRKIADIISVIDGIAFQTNILALNAAVEAARAGEQGRGFAVVASEVRSLAGRSAEAAKEVKRLIGASLQRVEQGTSLVGMAGATMNEIVTAIKRVTDIMGEISSASVEQSAGVSQVGEAVGRMDQTTQQNAALVEESAAAAESLRDQAQQLVQAVAVFRLA